MEFWVCGPWQGKPVAIFPVSFRILMMFFVKKHIVVVKHLELSMLLFDKLVYLLELVFSASSVSCRTTSRGDGSCLQD
ncbi:unnamed protein product, partial [Musa textilis]